MESIQTILLFARISVKYLSNFLQIMWHATSVHCHLRRSVTLTSVAKRLAVELSLPVFTIYICGGLDLSIQPFACEENSLTDCPTTAGYIMFNWRKWKYFKIHQCSLSEIHLLLGSRFKFKRSLLNYKGISISIINI